MRRMGLSVVLASRLVASLARPGGNTTRPSMMTLDIAGKRLELLREVIPNLSRVEFYSARPTGHSSRKRRLPPSESASACSLWWSKIPRNFRAPSRQCSECGPKP